MMKKIKCPDFWAIIILAFTLPLFFYKLGQSSLVSWDEAWHADVARHISSTGDLFNLVFNGKPFVDHPPGVYWLMALIFKFFGISELTVRLLSALTGFFSLIVLYFLGQELFNRIVGFSSAVSLASAYWFLSRARAGDLDIPLVFFFLLTLYLAVKAAKNKKFFIPFSLSLAYLTIVKSFKPFAVLPVLPLVFIKSKLYKWRDFLIPFLLILLLWGGWLVTQLIHDPQLVSWYITHSFRGASVNNDFGRSFSLLITYLHNGIGRWFWPGIAGLFAGLFLVQKRFYILILFFVCYSVPFLFSPEVQIWHLIPLYPIMILSFYGAGWVILEKIFPIRYLVSLSLLGFAFYLSFFQVRAAWYQFIDIPAYVSDEAILSREAGKYPDPIFIDGDFDPVATFYAARPVTKLYDPEIIHLFNKEKTFLLVTNQWRLEKAGLNPSLYSIIKTDRDKVLIRKK